MSRKKKKRGSIGTIIILLIVVAMLVVMILKGSVLSDLFHGNTSESVQTASDSEFQMHFVGTTSGDEQVSAESSTSESEEEIRQLSSYNVHSDQALMVRLRDGAVFFDKASTEKMYPASMTKMMTCLIALEKLPDLKADMTIYQEDIDAHYKEGASCAGFSANETVPIQDVLYGIMLPSGAECCVAISRQVAGSEAAFVELMNQKAKDLGMSNTNFTNPIGLHNENHYSTCEDFIKLEKAALENETFREIFTTRDYTTTATQQHPAGISWTNTSFKHLTTTNLSNGALYEGGKTGYTSEALQTLASIAKYGEDEYIMVTAHGSGVAHANIDDAVTLYSRLGTDEVAGTEPTETPQPTDTPQSAQTPQTDGQSG
jgi:D-alanyl-D-alanine carboxypeptidase (penicillin-binding protein 5/6)